MMNDDAGSLQNLNDIVVPGAVPWWPPAPGWYAVAAVLAVFLLLLLFRWWQGRRRNRYRRQALLELASIQRDSSADALRNLPALIKRAALAVWPREQVAALSGEAWHRFLDETSGTDRFQAGAGATLDGLSYGTARVDTTPASERQQVLNAAEFWLRNHVRQDEGS